MGDHAEGLPICECRRFWTDHTENCPVRVYIETQNRQLAKAKSQLRLMLGWSDKQIDEAINDNS